MPVMRRKMDPGDSVAEIAGLMGPMGLPGAIGGLIGKARKFSPDDLEELSKLLGVDVAFGKIKGRLSSVDPTKNQAILHAADDSGSRFKAPIDDLLAAWRSIGEHIEPKAAVEPLRRRLSKLLGP